MQEITQAISESEDFNSALLIALCKICKTTGWVYGETWIPSLDNSYLECGPVCHSNIAGLEEFRKESEDFKFERGVGVPGRVWASKNNVWHWDITENHEFLRSHIAKKHGINGTVAAIPILAGGEVVAVMVFLVTEYGKRNERIAAFDVALVSTIVAHLGAIFLHKRSEELLRESESHFRQLAEASFEGIAIHDKGNILDANEHLARMFGYEPSEIIGKNALDLTAPESREIILKNIMAGYDKPYEAAGLRKDGTTFTAELIGKPIQYKGKTFRITAIRDITERKHLEEELLKVQRLEELGILAGGIAHDFNNLLTGILGYISLVKMRLNHTDKEYKWLSDAEESCMHAKELSNKIITFSKGGNPIKEAIYIVDILKEVIDNLLSGSNINTKFIIPEDLYIIDADKNQIREAIKNLVINAKEAMPYGGVLKVQVKNIPNCEKAEPFFKNINYLKISISDTGKGISKENIPKIFDPYFTTKEMGSVKGTGLGLSVCHTIIKKHDGFITVESGPGSGSNFNIYLPASSIKAG
ncbi:MAG: PAS domain S-box protein [Nitrospinae bacterium]|nr:PAS domain S-box protein [Nitrospinota bacterium]